MLVNLIHNSVEKYASVAGAFERHIENGIDILNSLRAHIHDPAYSSPSYSGALLGSVLNAHYREGAQLAAQATPEQLTTLAFNHAILDKAATRLSEVHPNTSSSLNSIRHRPFRLGPVSAPIEEPPSIPRTSPITRAPRPVNSIPPSVGPAPQVEIPPGSDSSWGPHHAHYIGGALLAAGGLGLGAYRHFKNPSMPWYEAFRWKNLFKPQPEWHELYGVPLALTTLGLGQGLMGVGKDPRFR